MRVISAHVRGYGRIVDSKVNLDSKVIAVVGPNEAGKTTFLKALAHLDANSPVPVRERSRSVPQPVANESPVITVRYVLDEGDYKALKGLDLQDLPRTAEMSRSASGEHLTISLDPKPRKSTQPLHSLYTTLLSEIDSASDLFRNHPQRTLNVEDADKDTLLGSLFNAALEPIREVLDDPTVEFSDTTLAHLKNLNETLNPDSAELKTLRQTLNRIVGWAEKKDPAEEVERRLWSRSPDFILFSEEDRTLRSSYTFDEELVKTPPPALVNLAETASLDMEALLTYMQHDDRTRLRTAINKANYRMDQVFGEAWKQSKLSVHFQLDGDQLHIELLEDDETVTVFDERSAGFRIFVALIAFLKVRGSGGPPVLLIDEAENHLHIDAQADLVNMFVNQEHAMKVIYTTHSPACLPPDLGTGIRLVMPREGNPHVSDIRNDFWQGSAGFSPLMFAMGAASSAFAPARFVVLSEGATEMILLPTLLRKALDIEVVNYQVAPGLSEVARTVIPHLDLEGARVAYLVDGDAGGEALRNTLLTSGVPERLIISLGEPGIENVLESESYRSALSALLREANPRENALELPPLQEFEHVMTDQSVAKWIERWIATRGLRAPSKVAIASWLVQNGRAQLSSRGQRSITQLDRNIRTALQFPNV